jgi:hypothetical protein
MSRLALYGATEFILGALFALVFHEFGWGWGLTFAVISLPVRVWFQYVTRRAIRRDPMAATR